MMKPDKEGKSLVVEGSEGTDVCSYCGNHPCVLEDLDEMLISIVDTYKDWKTNKQIRYKMYSDSTRVIYGSGLGKGVRKKLPHCVQKRVHSLAPDEKYVGFKDAKDEATK